MSFSDLPDDQSNVPNLEELLQMAIRAAKAGQKEGARVMLRKILSEDKRNERALIWMAKLADSKAERKQWLERVIAVNPDNESARSALHKMAYSRSARDNQMLLVFGVVVVILVVVGVVMVILIGSIR